MKIVKIINFILITIILISKIMFNLKNHEDFDNNCADKITENT